MLKLVSDATQQLVSQIQEIQENTADEFAAARQIVRYLGTQYVDGLTTLGFWVPELTEKNIAPDDIYLEVFTPVEPLDLSETTTRITDFKRERLSLVKDGDYIWGVVEGMQAGTRDQTGSFYWLRYRDNDGNWQRIIDYMANSVPYGCFAPAELYDMETMQQARTDKAHFTSLNTAPDPDGFSRIQPPTNILQIHAAMASPEKTIAGLNRIYQIIAEKIRNDEPLTPAEETYIGYDAIQLMPIEPTIEYEAGPLFWEMNMEDSISDTVKITLRSPDMTNWGYDILLTCMTATNPVLLESRRPDELTDLISTLHNFPGEPIMVILDIVYGHIDNQALPLLNEHFFADANMYGQNVNLLNPVIRAMMLEMQRRKHNYGIDGVRVDGAQDFKNWDPETQQMLHDDDFLALMNDIEQEVDGNRYRPWMIFEDGRPWPRDDWELASSYREITHNHDNVWQWGPLTFAHNTPFLFTFWVNKFWRIREMATVGSHWITGCANHDTLRRGTQVPVDARVNTYLGNSLPEIFKKGYDNPAAKLFDYAMMPGIPMDFLNASMHAPWGFIRNTDDRYGVKVVSEEARFLFWIMTEALYNRTETFPRLKTLGFTSLEALRRFMVTLDYVMQATDYDVAVTANMMASMKPPLPGQPYSVPVFKQIARAWMDDVHEFCNVWLYADALDAKHTHYMHEVREFRRQRPWLLNDLTEAEYFNYLQPMDGTVIFYGLRHNPDQNESLLFVANMEGEPRSITPIKLPIPDLPRDGWKLALKTPYLEASSSPDVSVELHDSQGLVFIRNI